MREALDRVEFDDYDRLIQLCDAIGTADGVAAMENRMQDIRSRYGSYPEEMWKQNLALREKFERRIGGNIYDLLKMPRGSQHQDVQGTSSTC